ncbi:MAG: PAS domain-containing protein [Proteobacteria bacterium]|nr:PAS domain-containing protein [Pseudomonadota bacterium]MBU1649849.1 PAS domain-containing protein [Pseudomonadota bacterium]MBU1986029.1 PAS domain-containing protein [Pseudomonadota bacterium]
MTTKTRILSFITLLFVGCTLALYYLDRLQADRTSTLQLPHALWSAIIMTGLCVATLALIHKGCKQYTMLLAEKGIQLAESTRSLLETQASLEEIVERRTFELAVVNGSLHREIAERIQTETESKKLQKRFEIILDSAAEGIFGIDTKGNVTFINKTASRLLGWRREDLIGNSHHDIVHHSHNDGSKYPISECPIHRSYKDGSVHYEADETFWTKSGKSFPVEYTSTPIVEDETLSGAVVVFRDISESNKLKKQLELIVNSAGEGIFGLDAQGNVTFINKAASIMLGWEAEDLIGKSHHDLVHHTHANGEHYPEEKCPIYMAYKDGAVHFKSDDIFWTKSGETFPVEYTSTPIRENRQLTGAVVVFRDLNTFT